MKKITKTIQNLLCDESGASAMEYGLLAALIGTSFILGAAAMGTSISNLTNSSSTEINQAINPSTGNGAGGGVGGGDGGGRDNNRGNGN